MRSAILLAVIAWSGVVYGQRDNMVQECFGKVADIFFVLDSSSSIYIEDYRRVLNFVSQVVTRFDVSRDDTRIGALTFSRDVQLGFDLTRFRSKGEILASINEDVLPYKTGVTNTNLAIRYVRENINFRSDITKVMVVITDGGSQQPGATWQEANLAREAGFHMVVVGVGQYLDEQEWRNIASDPNSDYLFNITDFNLLESIRDSLPRRICIMPPIILGGECRVTKNADMFFLSAQNGVNDALDTIQELADSFRSRERLNVRYVMDVCQDETDQGFQGEAAFCNRFGDAQSEDEDTYVGLVNRMRAAATAMKRNREANQVAILFIDDRSMRSNRFEILQAVRNAEQFDDIDIIVVDLGVRDYRNFVNGMTSDRDNVITFNSGNLGQSTQEILERICESVNFDFGDEIIPS